jgi:trk system potassium uptake protein TrkA
MFVVVAGGELTGAWLVQRLLEQGHRALLIEDRPEVLARIHRELPTEAVFHGNPATPGVLAGSGIAEAQVFVTLMPDDAVNLALCYLATTMYSVPRTIAGINDPRNAWLFDRRFRVTVGVDTTEVLAHLIEEETSTGEMMTLLKLRRGKFSLVEQRIPRGSAAIGSPIRDLDLPENSVIVAVIRRGDVIVPRGATTFQEGDEVLALTDVSAAERLARMFGGGVETPVAEG